MMGQFLDALGIKHEEGLITEDEMEPPSADRLDAASRALAGSYSADDVALYFFTLLWQDPETWAGLSDLPEIRDRFRDASSRPA
jgi:hypothetical protein